MPIADDRHDESLDSDARPQLVVAMTGASGIAYAVRLVQTLLAARYDVHLVMSRATPVVFQQELGYAVDRFLDNPMRPDESLGNENRPLGQLIVHSFDDLAARIASGSFLTDGMVVCPCSSRTLGAIASGTGENLIHRAAEVHLKERRRLILVTRETPVSIIHLENQLRAARAGATILPASPGFYHKPQNIDDLVDFIVARICDQLDVRNELIRRWAGE